MWFIGVEVEQETSEPPPKKNPGSTSVNNSFSFFLQLKTIGGHKSVVSHLGFSHYHVASYRLKIFFPPCLAHFPLHFWAKNGKIKISSPSPASQDLKMVSETRVYCCFRLEKK